MRLIFGIVAALFAVGPLATQDRPAWTDTFTTRLEALALMQTLNAQLLASRSSTATLETWCGAHHLADPARIVADAVAGAPIAPAPEQMQRLDVSRADEVKYRHVRLRCGTRILSDADNWYVPSRLTDEMNRLLDTTDTPFGRAVAPLDPYRRTFSVTLLWAPLPEGWERAPVAPRQMPSRPLDVPAVMFEHRAILYTGDHRPFSEVRERYQRDALAFALPAASRP
jgi:chorismate-pyruvate lyase